jgi:hypothetical protein
VKLEKISTRGWCSDSDCPTVYRTDRGSFVIQGNTLSAGDIESVKLGAGEGAVEIPEQLLADVAHKLNLK